MTTVNSTLPLGWWRDEGKRAEVEWSVEDHARRGLPNYRIAQAVGCSTRFVDDHLRRRHGRVGARPAPGQRLSARELQVLARLCDRDEPTIERAARDLDISASMVHLHLKRIYVKLSVSTRLGAYRVAVEDLDLRLPNWRTSV